MSRRERASSPPDPSRLVLVLVVVTATAALVGLVVGRSSATASDHGRAVPRIDAGTVPAPTAPTGSASGWPAPGLPDRLPRSDQGGLGEADGVVPAGVTVFDGGYPAVAKLDAALLGALRRAAADAARSRISLYVDSGWRSPRYQEQLLREAIRKYGSASEAARWVATPDRSAHVSGDAVDLGHADATAWLSRNGATYGLCQIYRNEPWHYELRPGAADRGCPGMYADAAHDPRMQP